MTKIRAKLKQMFFFIWFFSVFSFGNISFATCVGKVLNPITDVCWDCIFPLTIGGVPLMSSSYKDTKNPASPLCACNSNGIPEQPGVAVGFWEPVWVVEVTRTPYCFVSLGGLKLFDSLAYGTQIKENKTAFYHIHQYRSPILAMLNLFTDWGCMQGGIFETGYISEVDPSYMSDQLSNLMNPEIFLLSSPAAVMSCAADCLSPSNSLFWCSGCQGGIYPLTGFTSSHSHGTSTALLLVSRALAKLHQIGQAPRTATSSSKINGKLCKASYAPRIVKNQYRVQMVYPVVADSCEPLGATDLTWNSGKEFPQRGEDFSFIIWRKRNCCML